MSAETFRIEVTGPRISLLSLESALQGAGEIAVVEELDRTTFGQQRGLIIIIAAGAIALPPLMTWLCREEKGLTYDVTESAVQPDGTKTTTVLHVKVIDSLPPTLPELKEILNLPGVIAAEVEKALNPSPKPKP